MCYEILTNALRIAHGGCCHVLLDVLSDIGTA